jgi:hypothetical protein
MNIRGFDGTVDSTRVGVNWQQQNKVPSSIPPAPVPGFGMRHFWRSGMLTHKLEQLQQKDPEQFKRIVTQLAESLQQIADKTQSPDGPAAQLAQALRQVADSGDVAALRQLLQHPRLQMHMQDAVNDETPNLDTNSPTTQTPSFASILSMVQGGGIARAIGTAIRRINEALQTSAANSTSSSSVAAASQLTAPALQTSAANSTSGSSVATSASNQSTTTASSGAAGVSTSSPVNHGVLDYSTTQGTIAAIENAALMAIKTGI